MRCQLNQEMLWPTNSRNKSLIHNMDRMKLHFKLKFLTRHSWQYRGLAFLDTHDNYRAFPLSLRGTDSEALYRIFDKKIEIRPEENFLLLKLTCSSFLSAPYWLVARQM